jgi:phosphoenolpyruvate carboxylase
MTAPDKLSGKEKKEFKNALIAAFPNEKELNQMVEVVFNKPINLIVSPGNLEHQAFELIGWSIAQGKLQQLMKGALDENPDNADLKQFLKKYSIVETLTQENANFQQNSIYDIKAEFEKLHSRLDKHDVNFEKAHNKLSEISDKIDVSYQNMIAELDTKTVDVEKLEQLIVNINNQSEQTIIKVGQNIMEHINWAFEKYGNDFDANLQEVYNNLKQSDNWTTKIKFFVPLLNLVGINIEHEVRLNKYIKWLHNTF